MDSAEEFAAEAARFEQWARSGTETGAAAVRTALLRITRLYLAALALPPVDSADEDDESDDERVDDDEWRAVFAASARLPFDYYGEVFDPAALPPEQPGVGSLADDIADIYRDVVSGLRTYRAGYRDVAVWDWRFSLRAHWGRHATGAIRALHCWWADQGAME